MNEVILKEVNIENLIYDIRGKQVMLDSYVVTKWRDYLIDKMITHYDNGKPISVFNNFIIEGEK